MVTLDVARWEIEQDDYGGCLVRHRHDSWPAIAYVYADADPRAWALCSSCGARLELPSDASSPFANARQRAPAGR